MTPEEKAVVQAAIEWRRAIPGPGRDIKLGLKLEEKIWELITRCSECNYDRHVCPGDGNPIGHGDTDCGEHDDAPVKPSEEREHLREQLQEIGQGTMQEWMRIVDLTGETGFDYQARVTWETDDGFCHLGDRPGGDEYGRFRLKVTAVDLGPVPPIGPENDFGVYGIVDERPGEPVSAGQEEELERQGREIAAGQHGIDLGDGGRPMVFCQFCNTLAMQPHRCSLAEPEPPTWVARTMTDVRPGDTIRPAGADIAGMRVTARCWSPGLIELTARDRGSWHVIESGEGHWSDHVVQPGECCVHLDGAGHRLFKPTFGVEIQLTASEVAAIELLGWDNRERLLTSE